LKYIYFKTYIALCVIIGGIVSTPVHLISQNLPDETPLTVDFVDVPLDSALLLLSASSGVFISFDPAIIPQERLTSLSANRLLLGLALDNVFVHTDLYYKLVGNQIVIKKKSAPPVISKATMTGFLKDDQSGEALIYATVAIDNGKYGATTNEYGFYSITLPISEYQTTFSYLGYTQTDIMIDLKNDTTVDVRLTSASASLNEVFILGEVPKTSKHTEDFDQLPIEALGAMPSLGGEPDIIRMAQMRSGVATRVDGFGGLQVRGGSPDQNLILLDGVPVYNTGHALGLFSIFNSSAIKSANLIKGGFPARYGGRLSSVLDVRTKDGNNQEISGDAAISPLMLKATIEGPISKGKSSFILSARRTIVDPWLKPLSRYQFERNNEDGQINFFFYDINAKVNFQLGQKHQLYLSYYNGKDSYANDVTGSLSIPAGLIEELDESNIAWGNEIATVRWTANFSKKLFGHASLSMTNFNFDNFSFNRTTVDQQVGAPAKRYFSRLFSSDIQDFIAAYELDWYANAKYFVKLGVNYTQHSLTPGSDFSTTTINNRLDDIITSDDRITIQSVKGNRSFTSFDGHEIRIYAENEIKLGRQFAANIGGHFSSIKVGGTTYNTIQPRVSAQWKFNQDIKLKAGYSIMDQYFHLLSSAGLGLPSDVWLPSTDLLPPERSRQISLGLEASIIKDYTFSISAFDKTFRNVTGYAQGASLDISGIVDWQRDVPVGHGDSRGLELEIEKRAGKVKGWISYTLSQSNRTFEELNNGRSFRGDNDRRHLFNFVGITQINENMELSLGWTYGSSLPTTAPASTDPVIIDGNLIWVPIIPGINNVELPPYHKLDIGLNIYNKYSWGSQKLSLGAYNAYARKNPLYIDVNFNEAGDNYRNEQISLLPFIPYVSLGVSF